MVLILWGAVCGALFLLIFVSKMSSGQPYAYLLMAVSLTASWLSVSTGRRLAKTPTQATQTNTRRS